MKLYDIGTDAYREVTQVDVDSLVQINHAFGMLVAYLWKSERNRDSEAAEIATAVALGRTGMIEGTKQLRLLVEQSD